MSWMDDYLKQQQGAQQAQQAAPPDDTPILSGFIGSTLSSIPELFGANPAPGVEQWRAEHPIGGFLSEMAGFAVPYGGAFKLSRTATGGAMLDKAMGVTPGIKKLTAVDNPILHGAAKEFVRYAPVEIARLGVGLGTTDDWEEYGNLFADVALSSMITGGFGGIGGLFRVGGTRLPDTPGVAGAPEGLKSTWQYRMSKAPTAESASPDIPLTDVQNHLLKQVFQETPDTTRGVMQGSKTATKPVYIDELVGGTPEGDAAVDVLFRPVGKRAGKASLSRQAFMKPDGTWTFGDDKMAEITAGLSERTGGAIKSIEDMAENMHLPRHLTVNDNRSVGVVNKALENSALMEVAPGVMAAKEAAGGLHVMAVRLKAGDEALGAATATSGGVAPPGFRFYSPEELGTPGRAEFVFKTKEGKNITGDVDITDKGYGLVNIAGDSINELGAAKVRELAGRVADALPNITHIGGLRMSGARFAAGKTGGDAIALMPVDKLRGRFAAKEAPKSLPAKITPGDEWVLFKTDKPHLFAPKGYTLAKQNVENWAKMRDSWRLSGKDDVFNKAMDNETSIWTPKDVLDAARAPSKTTFVAEMMPKLANKFAETAGLKGSETFKKMAEQFYDHIVPTVVNERKSPLFARMLHTLRVAANAGDKVVNQAIGGKTELAKGKSMFFRKNFEHKTGIVEGDEQISAALARLTDDEVRDFYHIGIAEAPADALEQYTANGLVSENLRKAIETVQRVDKKLWEEHLIPAFKNAELSAEFELLKGYTMPKLWTGTHFVQVVDEKGKLVWLANGKASQAMSQANMVIKKAAEQGRTFRVPENGAYLAGVHKPVDQIKNIHDLVQMQVGKDADLAKIIQSAIRQMQIDRAGKGRGGLPNVGAPKSLIEKRTGIFGSADDAMPTADEITKAIDSHYKQLFKFGAVMNWSKRFMSEAKYLEAKDKVLFDDLMRKRNQIMGYEGKYTAAMNDALSKGVLGNLLGGKAASKIASETNGLLYAWNLGIANPTFSLLNVLSPIQTVLPHLTFILSSLKKGLPELVENDMHLTLRHGADGLPREIIGVLSPAKIMGKAIRYGGKDMPDDLREFHGIAKLDGTTGAQLHESFIGGQSAALETIGDAFKRSSWDGIKKIATFTAERSEEFGRMVAFNSYYILGKEYMKLEGDQLYRFMQNGTRNSMFGYSLMDRSRIFTGPVGSVFGLFKNWQMHFIASMAQYAGVAVKHNMWGPLLWQFGAAGAIGGFGAMGPVKWTADALAKWNSDSPDSYLWMQENWGESADEIYFGLPALFGASLQASSTLPGTDIRNDITSLSSFVAWERAKAVGKATGAAWDYADQTGQNPLKNANIRDALMGAYLPRAGFRAMAGIEGDYIKSMTSGYPQVRDVSPLSKFLYQAGLNQVQVDQQQIAARALWKDKEARRKTISQLGIQLADAQQNGDFEEMQNIQMRAMAEGVEPSKVYKSAMTRLRREQSGDLLSQYKGEMAARYRNAAMGEPGE